MDKKSRIYFYHLGLSVSSWKHPLEGSAARRGRTDEGAWGCFLCYHMGV